VCERCARARVRAATAGAVPDALDLEGHRVIPLPQCPDCGGAERAAPIGARLKPDASPDEILEALEGFVDPVTGIISGLQIDRPDDERLPIIVTAAPPRIVEADGSLRWLPIGWGKGTTLSDALLSGVGEAIERYSASLPQPHMIRWYRLGEVPGDVVDPRTMPLYSDAQYRRRDFPFVRFDPDVAHPWVPGIWADSLEPIWVPAVFAYLSLEVNPENLICQGTSNGLAAGTSFRDAAIRAYHEILERDAFMTAWMTATPGRRVAVDDPIIDAVEALGGRVSIFALPTVEGSTIIALARGDGVRFPGAALGLGGHATPRLALRSALLELGQSAPHLKRMMTLIDAPKHERDVHAMIDHAAFYFSAKRAKAFDFLDDGGEAIAIDDIESKPLFRTRIAFVDVTSSDVGLGPFRVVRAISPDLQPISYGYGMDRQPLPRIKPVRRTIHPIW